MSVTRVISLVATMAFALGMTGPVLAQTPATSAPAPAAAQPGAPAKSGEMKMEKMDKMEKTEKMEKKAAKVPAKKKHAAKKAEGEQTPAAAAPEQPKK